jgi:uncharacterized protein
MAGMLGRAIALLALCLAPLAPVWAQAPQVAVPALDAPVVDTTATLDAAQTAVLTRQALQLQQRKGSQLQVLLVPSTGAETIEQYAQRVFDAWKLGRRGVDDGVLLLVAKDDHRVRIQTGYGLEGAIPDALANRIIEETLLPHFRDDDYAGGIAAARARRAGGLEGEPLPPPRKPGSDAWSVLDSVVAAGLAIAFAIGLLGRRRGVRVRVLVVAGTMLVLAATGAAMLLAQAVGVAVVALVTLLLGAAFVVAGYFFDASRLLRGLLVAALAVALLAALSGRWIGGQTPGLALIGALLLAVGIVGMLLAMLGQVLLQRWRAGRAGFFVRLLPLAALTTAYAVAVYRVGERHGPGPVAVMVTLGGIVGFFVWYMGMGVDGFVRGNARGRGGRHGGGSGGSSSGGWSGGGGSSGGGGASGSW